MSKVTEENTLGTDLSKFTEAERKTLTKLVKKIRKLEN